MSASLRKWPIGIHVEKGYAYTARNSKLEITVSWERKWKGGTKDVKKMNIAAYYVIFNDRLIY